MISEKMQSMINDQINYELFSSYLYYAMAAYFEESDLPGFANWMQIQTREELIHVDKFFNYVNERDGRVTLKAIEAPETSWESPLAAFQEALEHERSVSARINELAKQALSKTITPPTSSCNGSSTNRSRKKPRYGTSCSVCAVSARTDTPCS